MIDNCEKICLVAFSKLIKLTNLPITKRKSIILYYFILQIVWRLSKLGKLVSCATLCFGQGVLFNISGWSWGFVKICLTFWSNI